MGVVLGAGNTVNNSRKPGDQVRNMHNDSLKKGYLTLSQGKMKREMM
jgi:hypothetical protein